MDEPLTPANVKDVVSGISGKLNSLVTQGRLIGAECWFDILDNPTTGLRQGQVRIRYKYTPVPPMEDLTLYQTFTDEYFESAFSSLGGINGGSSQTAPVHLLCERQQLHWQSIFRDAAKADP